VAAPPELAARIFRGLSQRRGRRVFHPYGVGFAAVIRPLDGGVAGVAGLSREADAIVRLSRALGLPELMPDPCGVGLRVADEHGPGRHQDFLLVSSASPPVGRHALLPSRGFGDRPYSTILPYRLRGRTVLIGARAVSPGKPGPTLAELRERDRAGFELEFSIAGLRGAWWPLARVSLGARLPGPQTERLDLDPTNSGGDLQPTGLLNRLRGPSYRASHAGRAAAYAEQALG